MITIRQERPDDRAAVRAVNLAAHPQIARRASKPMTAKLHGQDPEGADLYDTDIVARANEQARPPRAGRLGRLDIEHNAEEIEDVGKGSSASWQAVWPT